MCFVLDGEETKTPGPSSAGALGLSAQQTGETLTSSLKPASSRDFSEPTAQHMQMRHGFVTLLHN